MEVLLLHNENAGDGGHSRDSLTALLRRAGYAPVYRDLHAAIGTSDLFEIGEFVVAAGGDGSLRRVALALLGHDRALAPLPLGTANNIARSLALPRQLDRIARGWARGTRRRIDVGAITGPWGRRTFIEGVGFGLIPRTIAISEYLHPGGGGHGGKSSPAQKLARDRAVIAALAHEVAAHPTTLRIDDADFSARCVLLEILNINHAGPGIEFAPAADPFDGAFDLVAVRAEERARLQALLKSAVADGEPATTLPVTRCRRVRVTSDSTELRIDDEIMTVAPQTPLEIELQPAALEIVLPS